MAPSVHSAPHWTRDVGTRQGKSRDASQEHMHHTRPSFLCRGGGSSLRCRVLGSSMLCSLEPPADLQDQPPHSTLHDLQLGKRHSANRDSYCRELPGTPTDHHTGSTAAPQPSEWSRPGPGLLSLSSHQLQPLSLSPVREGSASPGRQGHPAAVSLGSERFCSSAAHLWCPPPRLATVQMAWGQLGGDRRTPGALLQTCHSLRAHSMATLHQEGVAVAGPGTWQPREGKPTRGGRDPTHRPEGSGVTGQ